MAKVACADIPNVVVTYTDGIVVKKAKELEQEADKGYL